MRCDRILILAAGRASRMKRSAADASKDSNLSLQAFEHDALNRPKPMIRIGPQGEPLLQFILEQALCAGFTEATVVLHPDDAITQPFVTDWNETPTGLKMKVGWARQNEPLGMRRAMCTRARSRRSRSCVRALQWRQCAHTPVIGQIEK